MDITHTPPETIMTTVVVGEKLYGGSSNPNFAKPNQRRVSITVRSNDRGQCLGSVSHPSTLRGIGASPVLPSRAAADAWVAEVSEYVQDTLTDQIGEQRPAHLFGHGHSMCSTCGGVDTFHVSNEAWLVRTACTQCDDESTFSLGD